jgi:hypothetical protein
MKLEKYKTFACTCPECQRMCELPCWPTVEEAEKLIAAGHARKLMIDRYVVPGGQTYVLCPAAKGCAGKLALESRRRNGCVFLVSGLCQLHAAGLKPIEGRLALCDGRSSGPESVRPLLARRWLTRKGRALIARWCQLVGVVNPNEL